MTKMTQQNDLFLAAFMLSGVFCFIIAALFMFSGISGEGVNHPFSLLTGLICR